MAKKPVEPITLKEIAEELNDVMQYGVDPESGELARPEEQIDVNQKEKALLADIIKNAKADLRPDDENQFSEDCWNWFLDNGITPGADTDDVDGDAEEDTPPAKGKASKGKSEKAAPKGKASKDKDEDGGEKRGIKKAMVPGGNEAKAVEIVKGGGDLEDCIAEFTKIYKAAGNTDKEYILKRAKIYYGIACKKLGIEPGGSSKKAAPKGKASKEDTKAPAKGKGRQAEPEDDGEEDDAPKSRGRGRR